MTENDRIFTFPVEKDKPDPYKLTEDEKGQGYKEVVYIRPAPPTLGKGGRDNGR